VVLGRAEVPAFWAPFMRIRIAGVVVVGGGGDHTRSLKVNVC
jgi:hypothetical protein